MAHLTISQIAQLAQVSIATIRYYERTGLIAEPPRRESGYRQYPPETVRRLRFIRRAKDLGFTLHEIGDLLKLTQRRDTNAKDVKTAMEAKRVLVDEKISETKRIRRRLQTLIDVCPGYGSLEECPIIAALNQ